MSFSFPGAVVTGVMKILGDTMGPAVRDGLSLVIRSLGWGLAGITIAVGSVVVLLGHGFEKIFDFGQSDSCIG